MRRLIRLLPRTLTGRVFALYMLALLVFVGAGLALFYRYQFARQLDAALERADALVDVVAPAVADSAVIGDYDTIKRTLGHAIARSDFAYAAFIDLKGGVVQAESGTRPEVAPPDWLRAMVSDRLFETNLPIAAGGRDYGVLRLRHAADHIAGDLWRQARIALALAGGGLALGLLLIWFPLRHWLGNLDRLQAMGDALRSGLQPAGGLAADAPIEFQRTFEAFNRVAATLHDQRERATVTLEAIGDGVFTLDAQGRILLANPAACEIVAMSLGEMLGRGVQEVLGELAPDFVLRPWRGRRLEINARDGHRRVLDTTLSAITEAGGGLQGHVLACRDISEQHALDRRLQDELRLRGSALTSLRGVLEGLVPQATGRLGGADDIEAVSSMISQLMQRVQEHSDQLDAIFALSPDGFVSFGANRTVTYVSPAFSRLTGIDDAEALGLEESEFERLIAARCLSATAAFPAFESLAVDQSDGKTQRRRFIEIQRPTRRTLELALRAGNRGNISQVLHLRDVTSETEVDQMKSEFLSTAAHELRTPMASIYGFAELMMMRRLSPERQQEVIETIHRQTGLMISIVNELLDLARIEARRGKDFKIETVDLGALVAEVVHDFRPPDGRDEPRLQLPDAVLAVKVDRSKMAQALGNVLSNAYKYSPGGGAVELAFEQERTARTSRIGLRVRDHGIGMTPEQLARVCERFYRADASGSIPGTGLGMSIVKEILELLGGTLGLTSTPGEGTEVTLWLPLAGEADLAAGDRGTAAALVTQPA